MDSKAVHETLRARFRSYLKSPSRGRRLLTRALNDISARGWSCAVVGGLPRDLALAWPTRPPRDVDIVVEGPTTEQLHQAFAGQVTRRTKFGGLVLNLHGWRIDIWPLTETWGFKNRCVEGAIFENLPRTTFLNIDAVAIELSPRQGHARRIYEHGFSDAILNRVIEVNLEENPYPYASMRRALFAAARLGFAIGPRLVRLVSQYGNDSEWESLLLSASPSDERKRYQRLIRNIQAHEQRGEREPLAIPPNIWPQLSFLDDLNTRLEKGEASAYSG